jgi:hypothetical protein
MLLKERREESDQIKIGTLAQINDSGGTRTAPDNEVSQMPSRREMKSIAAAPVLEVIDDVGTLKNRATHHNPT